MKILSWAGAIALVLIPFFASAQVVTLPQVKNAGGISVASQGAVLIGADGAEKGNTTNPITIACTDAVNVRVACGGGGGGGGTGDASAANQSAQIAAEQAIRDRIGATSSPATGSTNWLLTDVRTALLGTLTVGTHAVTQSGAWSVSLASGGLGASGTPIYTASNTPTTGTPGAAAPAYAQQVAGAGPSGNLRALSTGTNGGLLPGQAAPVTPAPVAVAASTATSIDSARATRIGLTIQTETATTAIVYLCLAGQTNCSATVHDMVIPSGAGIGTLFTPLFAPTGAIYAFSTAAVTLAASSWIAQ